MPLHHTGENKNEENENTKNSPPKISPTNRKEWSGTTSRKVLEEAQQKLTEIKEKAIEIESGDSKNEERFNCKNVEIMHEKIRAEEKLDFQKEMHQSLEQQREKILDMVKPEKMLSIFMNKSTHSDSWLLDTIQEILDSDEIVMQDHGLQFENTKTASKHNSKLLKKYNYSSAKLVAAHPNSTITPGSEFRKPKVLENFFHKHEDWNFIKAILTDGADYPINRDIVDEEKLWEDLIYMIKKGNHKSTLTIENNKEVQAVLEKEALRGWQLPIKIDTILKIPGAMYIPIGIIDQTTVNKNGEYIPKKRWIHDCKYEYPSGQSLNKIVDLSGYPKCRYGHALLQYLHQVHQSRLDNPDTVILQIKTDLDSAYSRLHTTPDIAVKQITIVNNLAYVTVRLPFGSKPAPVVNSTTSDTLFDLANDLLREEKWDPEKLHAKIKNNLPEKATLDKSIPFGKANRLCVPVPKRQTFIEGYVDDGIGGCLDIGENLTRLQNVIPLSTEVMFRPITKTEKVKRNDQINETKLQGEGKPSEIKVILGWEINTRKFCVHLPVHTYLAWNGDLQRIIKSGETTYDDQKKVNGRLTRASYIFKPGKYFLNRLRELERRCEKYGKQQLSQGEKLDFILWTEFLEEMTTNGVSINNITHTTFDAGAWSDACEHGLGGYTSNGSMFSYHIPAKYQNIFSINLLEFLAAKWTIYLATQETKDTEFRHVAHAGDNVSAVSWLQKTSFNSKSHPEHSEASRNFARLLMKERTVISNCHKAGVTNFIADILSRNTHLPTNMLKFVITHLFPNQVPTSLNIVNPEKEINSELALLMQSMHNPMASPVNIKRSNMGLLLDGCASSKEMASRILGLTRPTKESAPSCCPLSQKVLEEMNLAQEHSPVSELRLLAPPLATYARPFGRIFGTTLE